MGDKRHGCQSMESVLLGSVECSPLYTVATSLVVVTVSLGLLAVPFFVAHKGAGLTRSMSYLAALAVALPWLLAGKNGDKNVFQDPAGMVVPLAIILVYSGMFYGATRFLQDRKIQLTSVLNPANVVDGLL
jgi:hypothetical protein